MLGGHLVEEMCNRRSTQFNNTIICSHSPSTSRPASSKRAYAGDQCLQFARPKPISQVGRGRKYRNNRCKPRAYDPHRVGAFEVSAYETVCIDVAHQGLKEQYKIRRTECSKGHTDEEPKCPQKTIIYPVFRRNSTGEDEEIEHVGRKHFLEEIPCVLGAFWIQGAI